MSIGKIECTTETWAIVIKKSKIVCKLRRLKRERLYLVIGFFTLPNVTSCHNKLGLDPGRVPIDYARITRTHNIPNVR